jgi:hypothetical protein
MSEIKKCPDCGLEMEKGYFITDALVIKWNNQKHKYFGTGELLERDGIWTLMNLEGYRCAKCKLALFYYRGKKKP